MIIRVAFLQAILIATLAVLIGAGVITVSAAALPWLISLGAIWLCTAAFLAWKIWFQPRLHGFRFNRAQSPEAVANLQKRHPVYYDTSGDDFSWVNDLETDGAREILSEVRQFIAEGEESPAFKTAYQNDVLSLSPTWKTLNLMSYGTVSPNVELLPRTWNVIDRLPNVFTCNLSKMGPQTELKPHAGESTSYIRCHLGVQIPDRAPNTALHVAGQERSWDEGKVIAFCDGHWHGARNKSDEERYVLIFDVMPERLSWYTKQFCALMVATNVTQLILPGRLSLDEPMWKPPVLLGYLGLATIGTPLLVGFYFYFRYFCRDRTPWTRRLAKAGFGFYY
jgi:hypothetical protein